MLICKGKPNFISLPTLKLLGVKKRKVMSGGKLLGEETASRCIGMDALLK